MSLQQKFYRSLRSGKMFVGTWMQIPHIVVAELLSQSGFDFILLDGEHAPVPPDELYKLLPATDRFQIPVLYRVRSNSSDLIKAALDAGVAALIVPMVNSPQEAAYAVASAKYPPVGKRGIGPWRASNYYLNESQYVATAGETAIVVQIETGTALDAVEEIAATPGIDALYIGPADLSMSLGLPLGQLSDGLFSACAKVAAAAKRNGIAAGIDVATLDYIPTYRKLGFDLLTYGLDTGYLMTGGKNFADDIRRVARDI